MAQGARGSNQTTPRSQKILTNTDLTVDGDITLTGEINNGLIAKLNNLSQSLAQITNGQGYIAGDLYARGHFYQSVGKLWYSSFALPSGLSATAQIKSLFAIPNTSIIFGAALTDGLVKSTDGGITWTSVTNPLGAGSSVIALGYNSATGKLAVVGISSGSQCCVATSTDNGSSWSAVTTFTGMGSGCNPTCIVSDNKSMWLVGFYHTTSTACWYSTDDATTWQAAVGPWVSGQDGFTSICFCNFSSGAYFVATGAGSGPFLSVLTVNSSPGISASWVKYAIPGFGAGFLGASYVNGVMACSARTILVTDPSVYVTRDGFNWTAKSHIVSFSTVSSAQMFYSNGVWVAVFWDAVGFAVWAAISTDNWNTYTVGQLSWMPAGSYSIVSLVQSGSRLVAATGVVNGAATVQSTFGYTKWMSTDDYTMNYGSAVVDFGAFPGASDASLVVTGVAGIAPSNRVFSGIMVADSIDHSADEHRAEQISISAGNIVAGVGFTIYARCVAPGDSMLYGKWNVWYLWN